MMNEWRMIDCCYAVQKIKDERPDLWDLFLSNISIDEGINLLYEEWEEYGI